MSWNIKIDQADKYFSQWIRLRDRECRRCHSLVKFNEKGLPISHQNSHFKGRRKEGTRFEPLNCDTLCGGCHSFFTENPTEHEVWQVMMKGQKTVDKLILLSNTYRKKDRELEKIYWKQRILKDYGIKA
jgi:nitrate/TMAO reductase-like tetraheme cytochrome c subunit